MTNCPISSPQPEEEDNYIHDNDYYSNTHRGINKPSMPLLQPPAAALASTTTTGGGGYFDGPVLYDPTPIYFPMKLMTGPAGKIITQPCFPSAHHIFTSPIAAEFILGAITSTLDNSSGGTSTSTTTATSGMGVTNATTTTPATTMLLNERLHLSHAKISWCLYRAAQQEGDLAVQDLVTLLTDWGMQPEVANTRNDLPKPFEKVLQVLVPKAGGVVRESIWTLVGLINSKRDLRRCMLGSVQLCLGIMEEPSVKCVASNTAAAPISMTIVMVPAPEVPHPTPRGMAVPIDPHYHGVRVYKAGHRQQEYYPDPDLFVALANLLVALDRSWRYPQYSLFKATSDVTEEVNAPYCSMMEVDTPYYYPYQHQQLPLVKQPMRFGQGMSGPLLRKPACGGSYYRGLAAAAAAGIGGENNNNNNHHAMMLLGGNGVCDEEEGYADMLRGNQRRGGGSQQQQVEDVDMVEAEEGLHIINSTTSFLV